MQVLVHVIDTTLSPVLERARRVDVGVPIAGLNIQQVVDLGPKIVQVVRKMVAALVW